MERMLCSDLSYFELVRFLSPAERRAYWFGRQIGYFRRNVVDVSRLRRTRSSTEGKLLPSFSSAIAESKAGG